MDLEYFLSLEFVIIALAVMALVRVFKGLTELIAEWRFGKKLDSNPLFKKTVWPTLAILIGLGLGLIAGKALVGLVAGLLSAYVFRAVKGFIAKKEVDA